MIRKTFFSQARILGLSIGLGLLCGCGSQDPAQDPVQLAKTREGIVREAALSYASRYALYWESQKINEHVQKNTRPLDAVFNFNALYLTNNLLPPVLVETTQNVNASDPNILRISDRMIQIIRPASFMSVAPSWRHYLMMAFPIPEKPIGNLLPRSALERQVWDEAIAMGWKAGRIQASQIFRNHIGTLQRDYTGMVLYFKLLAQGMISPSHAAVADLGVTGDGQSMQLNDRLVKITSQSELLPDRMQQWKPAFH